MAGQPQPVPGWASSERLRKAQVAEPKAPGKVTPIPLPKIPSRQPHPPRATPRPVSDASASHVEGPAEAMRRSQSETAARDNDPTSTEERQAPRTLPKAVIEMKRTGTALSPFEARLASEPSSQSQPAGRLTQDPDPPLVVSDINLPTPPLAVSASIAADPLSEVRQEGVAAVSQAKKHAEEKRRKVLSQSLKARWSSGAMAHVPAKRKETLRKRKAEEMSMESSPADEPVATPSQSPLASSALTAAPASEKRAREKTDFAALFSSGGSTPPGRSRRSLPAMVTSVAKPPGSDVDARDEHARVESPDTGNYPARDVEATDIEDGKSLWQYILPFLTVHHRAPPPMKGYVPELLALPRVRDLEWNADWVIENPYVDSRAQDISAMLMQITGEPAPEPCMRCAEGKGPFNGCIMLSRKAHDNPLETVFSCANCYYHCRQTYCNHKTWGAKRNARIREARAVSGNPHLGVDGLQSKTPQPMGSESPFAYADGDVLVEDQSGDETPRLDPAFGPSIKMAEPGRPYDMWPEYGILTSMHGALLPKGYRLEHSFPGREWICTVRSCRRVFQSRKDLGFHFNRVHFGCLMNDNGDGTLTITGIYKSKADGIGRGGKILSHAPPIVTSTHPIDPAEPLPNAQLPRYLMAGGSVDSLQTPTDLSTENGEPRYPTRRSIGATRSAAQTASVASTGSRDSEAGDPEALWSYISPLLRIPIQPSDTGFIKELLRLPQRRNFVVNPRRISNHFRSELDIHIAAIIIQLTGQEAGPCSRCKAGKGPFEGCYRISSRADSQAKKLYTGCANCLYRGKQEACTLVTESQQNEAPGGLPVAAELARKDGSDQYIPFDRQAVQMNTAAREQALQQSSLIIAGQSLSTHTLEMEGWEIAPGRVMEEAAEDPENVAFSKPFLSANHAVPVCDDVAFCVDIVKSGSTLYIEGDRNKTRICSIAAGKLNVRIKGEHEQEFAIGPHGMFKVKAGVSCAVTNRLYSDGILHTTVLSGYI